MSKKIIIIVVAALLAIAGITTTILLLLGNNPEPTPPSSDVIVPDGEESISYYYDVAAGEVCLIFTKDFKFTLVGPNINKSGDYIAKGKNITLDFVRDEDGTATAVMTDKTVVVNMNDATLTFLKKINYTVNFVVNGGSAIDAVSVLNGKTITAPATPSKNGYAFIAWYADSALKTLFDFDTTVITEDTTIYAKWGATSVDEDVFTITLNYGGASADKKINTIGGKLYFTDSFDIAPTMEGYSFAGWYVSIYNEGDKLSYAYAESQVFKADTTLFAVWTPNSGDKLSTPVPTISSSKISWSKIKDADNYTVTITDLAGNVVKTEVVAKTEASFNFKTSGNTEYIIYVTANDTSNPALSSESAVRYYVYNILDRVSKFEVVDGVISFNKVENAEKYLISVVCGDASHNHTLVDLGDVNSYDFSSCLMRKGGIEFTVTAIGSGFVSSTSATFSYELNLSPVENLVYHGATDSFTWESVEGATSYAVSIIVGGKTYIFNTTSTSISVGAYTGEISVSVVPKSTRYNSPEATTVSYTKTVPTIPTGLSFLGNILSWSASEGATGYVVKIGEQTYTVDTNSFDLSSLELSVGTTYISIQATNDSGASQFSEVVSVGYLTKDFALSYANNSVQWSYVIGAHNYEIRVNGGTPITVTDVNLAKIALNQSGTNLIEVRYTDGEGSDWMSIEVTAYKITYYTRSLAGEIVEYLALGDTMLLPTEGFSNIGYNFVNWYTAVENGSKYQGTTFEGDKDLSLYAIWDAKSYNITLEVDNLDITNIATGTTVSVKYNSFFTITVPTSTHPDREIFVGWFDGPTLNATRITDNHGNSLGVYDTDGDITLYPVFGTDILTYVLKEDGTYAVTAGPNFDKVAHVFIPHSYNGKAVTSILENAFESRKQLVSIEMPNTIELVGSGAFVGNTKLESITVYEVEGDHTPVYFSHEGALVRDHMGTKTLEVFPRAKTGEFTTPEGVTTIRNKVFQYSSISKVTISKDVTIIYERAFFNCTNLTTVVFEGGRKTDIQLMCGTASEPDSIFYGTTNVTSITFPAKMAEFDYVYVLDAFTRLKTINVEDGGRYLGSVNGLLTNSDKDTIIYAPKAISGDLEIPVAYVGDNAFYGRTGITSITIPRSVESIGTYAFRGCTGVTSIVFEGGRYFALNIGNYAFYGCTNNKEITFYGSNSDTALDNGQITIGTSVFAGSTNVTHVTFGKGVNVKTIGASAFSGLTKLYDLKFEDNIYLGKIDNYAFQNTAITTLVVPSTVTSIGSSAFASCKSLISVTFEEGPTSLNIQNNAFSDCTGITSIYIPASVTSFNGTVFNGCSALEKIDVAIDNPNYSSSTEGVLYNKNYTTLVYYPRGLEVDATALGKLAWGTLTTIGESAFQDHKGLLSFEIKKGITRIENNAFKNCSNLATLTYEVGGTALTIGNSAFESCGLTSASIPDYTTSIGNNAFKSSKFETFAMPSAIVSIGNDAFRSNTKLISIDLPAKLTSVGSGAFYGCTKLATVNVIDTEGAATITFTSKSNAGAFQSCTSLQSVDFKNRVSNISDYMFASSGLTSVDFSLATKVGSYAFYKTKLTSVSFTDKITEIGQFAFSEISTLTSVNIGSVTKIGNSAFYKNSLLTNVNLGTTGEIGESAFASTGITSITIPGTVYGIMKEAFASCKLSSVSFDAGTIGLVLGNGVFKNNTGIETVTFPARATTLETPMKGGSASSSQEMSNISTLFEGCTKLKSINVASGGKKYVSLDGVLYRADNNDGVPTTLLYCPENNTGVNGVLTIPKTVVLVENASLYNLKNISTIKFEEYDSKDPNFGKPSLHIGSGDLAGTFDKKYSVIGGTSNAVTRIEIPSHIAFFGYYSITGTKNTIDFVINPEADAVSIATYAFYESKIKEFVFPGVKELGDSAFSNTLSNGVYTTSEFSKMVLQGKELIVFGAKSTLETIPSHAFNAMRSPKFVVPASVKTIGSQAFYNSKQLKTVAFAAGSQLTVIRSNAFAMSGSITKIDLTNVTMLEEIGTNAFASTSITSFTFPSSIQEVGGAPFNGCAKLLEVHLPASFTAEMLFGQTSNGSITSLFADLNGANGGALFGGPTGNPQITTITVDSANTSLKVDSTGALLDYSGKILYYFPAGKDAPIPRVLNSLLGKITRIEDYAFQFFKGTSVKIGDSVTYIGESAFEKSSLQSVEIGTKVAKIGSSAFADCASLKTVTFKTGNTSLKNIGNEIFLNNKALTTVSNIPDSVTTIGAKAFYNCNKLTGIILPASLQSVSDYLFYCCYDLTSITLQQEVDSIGKQAFYMTMLTKIEIPSSVLSIGEKAFFVDPSINTGKVSKTELTTVTFGVNSKLRTIGYAAFKNNTKLVYINLPDSLEVLETGPRDSLAAGPGGGDSTKYPTADTFMGCTSLVSANIPGVSIIPDSTFEGCISLETVVLGEGVTSIGANAFYNNYALLSVEIPSTVSKIGTSAFENCYSLSSLTFATDGALTVLGTSDAAEDNIFKNTTSLTEVVLPAGLTFIGGHVFENSSITSINLDELYNLGEIGDYAFANCDNLEKVVILTNVTDLGDFAFYDCDGITALSVTFGLEYFGELAFGSCDELTDGYIPSSVFFLNGNPYAGSAKVPMVRIDDDNNYFVRDEIGSIYNSDMTTLHYYSTSDTSDIGSIYSTVTSIAPGAFAGAKFKSIELPSTLTELSPFLFFLCEELVYIEIPASVKTINDYAFYGCENLDNVEIPAAATTLGNYVFANCSSLSDVSFASTSATYTIGTHFFENCTSITEVILPTKFKITVEDAISTGDMTFYSMNSSTGAITLTAEASCAIPSYMFAGTGIVNAVIPASVTRLETTGVFMNCASLQNVTFKAGSNLRYSYIGNYMFYNCDSLVEIEIPYGQTRNPLANRFGYTFAECDNLVTIILYLDSSYGISGDGLVSIETNPPRPEGMFMNCKSLENLVIYDLNPSVEAPKEEKPETKPEDGEQTKPEDPEEPVFNLYGQKYLDYIGNQYFMGCEDLEKITIMGDAYIGDSAFEGCTSLAEVIFAGAKGETEEPKKEEEAEEEKPTEPSEPSESDTTSILTLEYLGTNAFKGCTALMRFTIPKIPTFVGTGVFEGFGEDQTIILSNTEEELAEQIANGMFDGCDATIIDLDGNEINL